MGERVGKRKRHGKGGYAEGLPKWGPQRRKRTRGKIRPRQIFRAFCCVEKHCQRGRWENKDNKDFNDIKDAPKRLSFKSPLVSSVPLSLHTRLPYKAPYMLRRGDVSLARPESALPLLRLFGPHTPEVLPKHYSLLVMRPMGGENNGTHEAHETRPETRTG